MPARWQPTPRLITMHPASPPQLPAGATAAHHTLHAQAFATAYVMLQQGGLSRGVGSNAWRCYVEKSGNPLPSLAHVALPAGRGHPLAAQTLPPAMNPVLGATLPSAPGIRRLALPGASVAHIVPVLLISGLACGV